jgi:TolA-binding protein
MTFAVAENQYIANDCGKATLSLQKYLNEFSTGAFVVDAHFYLADCYYHAGKLEEAMPHFVYVLNMPKSSYTEPALMGAAHASLELGENAKAAGYYERLEAVAGTRATVMDARVGRLRANYLCDNLTAVLSDVASVLSIDNLSPELSNEAYFKRAKTLEKIGAMGKAVEDYALVAQNGKTREGAEAQYKIIEYLFSKNELDKTEKAVLDFSKSGTSHQYWLAKSFIVLGDVYVKRNDAFQAKATYESIIDGYTVVDDGIIAEVTAKRQQLIDSEKAKEDSAGRRSSVDVVL